MLYNIESNYKVITLNQLIKMEAVKRNLSLIDLANEMGIKYPTLVNTSNRKPKLETYLKISKYLDIDLDQLVKYPIKL